MPQRIALPEPPARERRGVLGERLLAARAAAEVLGPVGVELLDSKGLDVGERQRRLHRLSLQRIDDETPGSERIPGAEGEAQRTDHGRDTVE